MAERKKLGEMLIEAGFIDTIQLQSALAHQKQWGGRLGTSLIELKFISERDLVSFLEQQLKTKCISILSKELSPEVIHSLTPEIARKYNVFPVSVSEKELVVATSNPLDLVMLDELGFAVGKRIKPQLAIESEIEKAIRVFYERSTDEEPFPSVTQELPPESIPVDMDESRRESKPVNSTKREVTTKMVIDALLTVLENKGIVSRAEVFEALKENRKK